MFLFSVVKSARGEPEVALRPAALVPRLHEATVAEATAAVAGGGYVVTGGLGALGLAFAAFLLEGKEKRGKRL